MNVEAAAHQQQQQQQQSNQNQHQVHFDSPNSRMSGQAPLNILSYDRVSFPVVHSLMNPINDQ